MKTYVSVQILRARKSSETGGSGQMLGDVNNETIGHANLKNRSERTESLKRK